MTLWRFIINFHRPVARSYRGRDDLRYCMLVVARSHSPRPLPNSDPPIYTHQHAKAPCHSRTVCRSECLFEWRWLDGRIDRRYGGGLARNPDDICGQLRRRVIEHD